MIFVYLDEFGHIGPYFGRSSRKHNESPVFGLAGIILPEHAVRPFASYFLEQKKVSFAADLENTGKMAAKWEKKGTSFIRPKPMRDYIEIRKLIHRVMKKVGSIGGNIFYYGREKIKDSTNVNPIGLYTTCLSHSLRQLDNYCTQIGENFVVVVDQHSARKELLVCASKTMYGVRPCRQLASPPFEVESYLNQNIQAADWIATLVGRIASYDVSPEDYSDYEHINALFRERLDQLAVRSEIEKRPKRIAGRKAATNIDPDNPFAAALLAWPRSNR